MKPADELEELINCYVRTFPAFRSKPLGAPDSHVRKTQDAHIALENWARAALAKLRGEA